MVARQFRVLEAASSSPATSKKRNDNFCKKIVVSFCSFHFSLFILLSSLKLSFPDKREERKEKRKGSFAPQNIEFNHKICYNSSEVIMDE